MDWESKRTSLDCRELLLVHPGGMARRLLGLRPLLDHRMGNRLHPLDLVRRRSPGGDLQAVATGIMEIDRFEDGVVGDPDDVEACGLRPCLGLLELAKVLDLEGDV